MKHEHPEHLNRKVWKIISLIWTITKAPKSGPVGHSPRHHHGTCHASHETTFPRDLKTPPPTPVLSVSGSLLLWGLVRSCCQGYALRSFPLKMNHYLYKVFFLPCPLWYGFVYPGLQLEIQRLIGCEMEPCMLCNMCRLVVPGTLRDRLKPSLAQNL